MKKMICKKPAALLLAGALLFGTAVPAYAQETPDRVTVSVTDGSKTETDTQYGNVQTCYSVSETEAI